MNNDLKEKIILPARKIIRDDHKIKKFYIFPGLLSIIFLTFLLVYQSIYTYVVIFGNKDETLKKLLYFLESDYGFEAIVVGITFIIVYTLAIPIFEGGLIKYIDFKNKGNSIGSSEAFGQGLYNFLPLFEYNNIFSEFKIMSILNFYLFMIRFIGIEFIMIINYIFIFIFILGLILNILFVYSKYSIVLNSKNVFESIGESSKISILNLKKTIKLYFLIFFLNLRVIINFIIFLFFPIMIFVVIGLITTKFLLIIALTILSIIFIGLILALGYLTAVLEVFKTSLWYYAYIEGKKHLEE
ncbi:MAG: hypothetical protein PHH98_04520 [Candidatus Gracilibacteria bacterium]|nr:hypothetical protein [Candidatus Gracilibacteria bacterium]